MKRKQAFPKRLSIDSGVILAYFLGEKLGELVGTNLLPPKGGNLYCSRQTISELFYMLCRRKGEEFAREAAESLLKSSYLSVISSDEIDIQAGLYKCSRAISLVDCYVFAVAKIQNVPAVFARREKDIENELRRKPFDVELLFIEDYLSERIPLSSSGESKNTRGRNRKSRALSEVKSAMDSISEEKRRKQI